MAVAQASGATEGAEAAAFVRVAVGATLAGGAPLEAFKSSLASGASGDLGFMWGGVLCLSLRRI